MEPPLRVARQAVREGACRVTVDGEIDVATVGLLNAALSDAITSPGIRLVILDLGLVTFMGARGVAALITARQLAAQHNCVLRIQCCSPAVIRVLELCDLRDDFGVPAAA